MEHSPNASLSIAASRRATRCLHLVALAAALAPGACSDVGPGEPCGGVLMVDAKAVLPDTGIGARGNATIAFTESEPNRTLDETALIVWTFPPPNESFADAPPRVRVMADDGRIFLDLTATSAYQGSWYVRQMVPKGALRDSIVTAFKAGRVAVEFAQPNAARATTVRPTVRYAGRTPVVMCI